MMATSLVKRVFFGVPIALAMSWATPALAENGSVSGTVTDPSGAIVVNATAELINLASNVIRSAKVDGAGKYSFTELNDGRYRLVIRAPGYNNVGRTIVVQGAPLTEDFQLTIGTIEEVITVTAGRGLEAVQDIPVNVTKFTSQNIENRTPTSAAEIIKDTPSLFIFSPGANLGSPNLRGLQSSRVLLVVDGERVNNSRTEIQSFGASLGAFIESFQVESAEVVAGAGSSLYGTDSLVGTVNFTTKAPVRPDTGWLIGTRFQGLYSQNEQGRKGNVTVNISNPWIAFNLSGSLYRYGYYHFGDTGGDIPLAAVMKQQDFLKVLSGSNDSRMDFALDDQWFRQFVNIGVPADATRSTVFGSESHGASGFFNMWIYPRRNHYIRYKQMNTHLGPYGYPGEAPPQHPQYQFASFEKVDRYGVRYQGLELNRLISRVAGGFYRQYLYRPIDEISFFRTSPARAPGAVAPLDTFIRPNALTFNKQGVVTTGFDGEVSLQLAPTNTLLVGYQFWQDRSADELAQVFYNAQRFAPGGSIPPYAPLNGYFLAPGGNYGKGTADGYTQEHALFLQDEYEPMRWLRLVGSFRYSRFTSKLFPAQGFPLPGFDIAINGPFPPGIEGAGVIPLGPVISKTGPVAFPRNVYTGSFAIIGRPHQAVSVFGRIGNSFRQPALIEGYFFRGFPSGAFAFIFAPNGNIKPERGVNVDTGIKVTHRLFRASLTYFNNTYTNFIEQTAPILQAGGPGTLAQRLGYNFLFWIQRFNTGRARVHGLESDFDVPFNLRDRATLTLSGLMSWEHGQDLLPLPNAFPALERQYQVNVREGKEFFDFGKRTLDANGRPQFSDVPFERVLPFMSSWNVRLQDKSSRFWTEYNARARTRIKRLDPDIQTNFLRLNYFSWLGMGGVTVHNWRFGYNHYTENYRTSFTLSLDNLGNKYYTDPFQRAAARGRSVIFGITIEAFNLLRIF